ncbi:MAG: hypothetical protein KatS3mg015_2759 [Fimbriimonadales bacterium]|nr:MAG: hypothetical protein KatS3mg015_2759 [Fimbriimonadales bacterium]
MKYLDRECSVKNAEGGSWKGTVRVVFDSEEATFELAARAAIIAAQNGWLRENPELAARIEARDGHVTVFVSEPGKKPDDPEIAIRKAIAALGGDADLMLRIAEWVAGGTSPEEAVRRVLQGK